jgi:hypothetical protein
VYCNVSAEPCGRIKEADRRRGVQTIGARPCCRYKRSEQANVNKALSRIEVDSGLKNSMFRAIVKFELSILHEIICRVNG